MGTFSLAKETVKAVILFPISFHLNRGKAGMDGSSSDEPACGRAQIKVS
jgi:hypothetical protein